MAEEPEVVFYVLSGLVEGMLAAVCFMYALQTRVVYPQWALRTLDRPWIITIATVCAFLIYRLSPKASILSILIILAFAVDIYIFTRHPIATTKTIANAVKPSNSTDSSNNNAGDRSSGQWGVDNRGWWIADGSLSPAMSAPPSLDAMGEPTAHIPLTQPTYPLYHATANESAGPAPFI